MEQPVDRRAVAKSDPILNDGGQTGTEQPPTIPMPNKLKEAITRRRDECNSRLAAAQQRESAAFQEAAMTLVQGWLCSQEIDGTVNVNLDDMTVTLQ